MCFAVLFYNAEKAFGKRNGGIRRISEKVIKMRKNGEIVADTPVLTLTIKAVRFIIKPVWINMSFI